jgi:hypothetical protein
MLAGGYPSDASLLQQPPGLLSGLEPPAARGAANPLLLALGPAAAAAQLAAAQAAAGAPVPSNADAMPCGSPAGTGVFIPRVSSARLGRRGSRRGSSGSRR